MIKEIILTKEDYSLLIGFVKNQSKAFSTYSLNKLAVELKNAKVVESKSLPKYAVRLNSEVSIVETGKKDKLTIKLVMPSDANVKENRISILAPIGSALIGYKKGDAIEWETPAGIKNFKIVDVINRNDN